MNNRVSTVPSRALAAVLAVGLVLVAFVGMLGIDVWQVLFNPPHVKQILTREVLTSDAVPVILRIFSEQRAAEWTRQGVVLSSAGKPDINTLVAFIDLNAWRKIKQLLLTDPFLTDLVSASVDSIYAWIDSNERWPAFVWDLTPFKTRLAGPQGGEAVMTAYAALPACTQADLADFQKRLSAAPSGTEILYNLCQFPAPWHDDQVNDYLESLAAVQQNIPARFDFGAILSKDPSSNALDPEALKGQLRGLRSLAQWSWVVAVVLVGLILALGVRSLRALGQLLGIPLFISGLLALATAWGGQAAVSGWISARLAASASPLLQAEIGRSLARLSAEFFQPLLIQGGILLVVGGALLITMVVAGRKKFR